MKLRHKILINIGKDNSDNHDKVVEATSLSLPEKLIRYLLGDNSTIILLSPGESVESIEVQRFAPSD